MTPTSIYSLTEQVYRGKRVISRLSSSVEMIAMCLVSISNLQALNLLVIEFRIFKYRRSRFMKYFFLFRFCRSRAKRGVGGPCTLRLSDSDFGFLSVVKRVFLTSGFEDRDVVCGATQGGCGVG